MEASYGREAFYRPNSTKINLASNLGNACYIRSVLFISLTTSFDFAVPGTQRFWPLRWTNMRYPIIDSPVDLFFVQRASTIPRPQQEL